ncbi:Flp family type IVb pilin [Bordetella petrii]|uniref:Flp family type IVb pilin n=1 Tax=Bordetella petrii TaxID=94624 RepID=UPI001A96D63F|nr:Flp family type IVb pilin [Bordetella petrii]MBO1112380.1 Flp family type IVb pilin [Bordetella petrii]
MKEQLLMFWNDEEGVTTLEYAILAALLVAGLATVISALTGGLETFFKTIATKLDGLTGTSGTGTGTTSG